MYVALTDLENARDTIDWDTVGDVIKIYKIRGKLSGMKAFYRDVKHVLR